MLFNTKKPVSSQQPAALGAIQFQTSLYGRPLALAYGTNKLSPNVIWYGDFVATAHSTGQGGGGKGMGGSQASSGVAYTYNAALMMALCEGPINGIGAVWQDKNQTNVAQLGLTVFTGTYPQTPWGHLTTLHPSQALAYEGVAYVANASYQLNDNAGLPNHTFEIYGMERNYTAYQVTDANPKDVIYSMLTDANFGVGFPAENIASWTDYSNYCVANGLFLSPFYTDQSECRELIQELLKLTNSEAVWSGDELRLVPYGDQNASGYGATYIADMTPEYDLTLEHFIAVGVDPVTCERVNPADAYNHVQLEIYNRANKYNAEPVEAKDQTEIETYGLRSLEPIQAHSITNTTVGRLIAQLILQRVLYIRNKYRFKLPKTFFLLDPMDLVTLTEPGMGLLRQLVRILEITEDEDGTLSFTAEEVPIGIASAPEYGAQAGVGYQPNYNADPGDVNTPVMFDAPVELADTGLEVWAAVSGASPDWGGCEIWISTDDQTYKRAGRMDGGARMGYTTNLLPSVNPDAPTLNPAQIFGTNLLCWHVTDEQDYRSISAGKINALLNKVNTAQSVSQLVDVNKPTLAAGMGPAGQDVAYFGPGADVKYLIDQTTTYPNIAAQPYFIAAILRPIANITKDVYRNAIYSVTGNGSMDVTESGASAFMVAQPGTAGLFKSFDIGSWINVLGIYNGAASALFVNGVASSDTPAGTAAFRQLTLGLGAGFGENAQFNGYMLEVIIGQGVPSETQINQLEAYLGSRMSSGAGESLGVDLTESRGELMSGTQEDSDVFRTLCWLEGELIAYQTATLTSQYNYTLTYLNRAGYGTTLASHGPGSRFARLDNSVFKISYTADQIGQTIYVKFLSFNQYGAQTQGLDDVDPYEYLIDGPPLPPNVQNFAARQNGNVVVFTWDAIDYVGIKGYDIGYAPEGATQWEEYLPLTEATRGTEMTNASVPPGTWRFGIRAEDIAGQLSPAIVYVDLTVTNENEVVYQQDQAPDWVSKDYLLNFDGASDSVSFGSSTGDLPASTSDPFTFEFLVKDLNPPSAQAFLFSKGVTTDVGFWLFKNPEYSFSFMGGELPPGVTYADASDVGTYWDSSGVLRTVSGNDEPRFTYDITGTTFLGLNNEPTRRDDIVDSATPTAVNGVIGSGGSLSPWPVQADSCTITILDSGPSAEIDGATYVDIQIQNSTGTTRFPKILFNAFGNIPAITPADTLITSVYVYRIGGTNPNQVAIGANWGTAPSGGYNGEGNTPITLGTVFARHSSSALTPSANTANYNPYINFIMVNGDDVSVRIVLPRSEVGAFATTDTLTDSGAVTRAASFVTVVSVPDETYDIQIVRSSGTTNVSDEVVSGGYLIPRQGAANATPIQTVTFTPSSARGDLLEFRLGEYDGSGIGHLRASYHIPQTHEWNRVSLSYDGTATLAGVKLYYNGIELSQVSGTDTLATSENISNAVALMMGNISGGISANSWTGVIKDVRVWDDVRTADEIAADMHQVLNGDEAGLVYYWPTDDGSGTNVADKTTNNRSGTITGATWSYEYVPNYLYGFVQDYVRHVLVPESAKLASAMTNEELFEQFVPYPVASSQYTTETVDSGFNDLLRVFAEYEIHDGRGVSGDPVMELSVDTWLTGEADPNDFIVINSELIDVRYIRYRMTMISGSSPNYMSALETILDREPRETEISSVTCAPGGTTVFFDSPFHNPPDMLVSATSPGATSATATDVTVSSAVIHVWTGTMDTGGTATWQASGE